MNLGPWFSVIAFLLSVVAAVVSVLDGDTVELPFFVVLAVAAATQAWCLRQPDVDWRRRTAKGIAVAWVVAAIWIGVLLSMFQAASGPPPGPEETYIGLTATVYHVVAVYGGALATLIAAFGPRRWGWR
jgi:hypothetical protein